MVLFPRGSVFHGAAASLSFGTLTTSRNALAQRTSPMAEPLIIAQSGDTELAMLPALANRHGCITGATGTGKTVTLQKMAESFSRIGVPVFMADVKGDLTGISQPGAIGEKMAKVLAERKIEPPKPQA